MEIAYCAIGVDGCEAMRFQSDVGMAHKERRRDRTESCLQWTSQRELIYEVGRMVDGAPDLAEASVKLFRVVLFPDDGLPTSAMRGSRGMASGLRLSSKAGRPV